MKNGWFSLVDNSAAEDTSSSGFLNLAQWGAVGVRVGGHDFYMFSHDTVWTTYFLPPSPEVLAACLFERVLQPTWLGAFPLLILGSTFLLVVPYWASHMPFLGAFSSFLDACSGFIFTQSQHLGAKISPCLYSPAIIHCVQTFELGPVDMTDLRSLLTGRAGGY